MAFDGLSSSVVIVLAAVLWFVYLVPTWLRRREYLATERNAVRLQQTLRIMAETAEVPEQVRAETTARSVAAQEKILQREMQRTQAIARAQDAAAARAAARQLAESQPVIAASVARSSSASRRLRRSRALSSVALFAALVAIGFGVAIVAAGGAPVLLVAGSVVAAGACTLLAQIAQVSRARTQLAQTLQPTFTSEVFEAQLPVRQAAPVRTSWTPVPIPKPLYLSRSEVASVDVASAVDVDIAGRLREASAADTDRLREAAGEAGGALRSTHRADPRVAAPAALVPAAVPDSRFSRMGIVDVEEPVATNLDEVLRRRRAV